MEKRGLLGYSKLKVLVISISIGILLFLGFELYLYTKFLIGNDLIIQLESNNKDISLVYGQSKNVEFKMSKITSPLCQTECEYLFFDVSKNMSLDSQKFNLGQIFQKKEETLFQNKLGNGQKLYRFNLKCQNVKTFLCPTSELPMSRGILITVEYKPNQEQQNLAINLSDQIYMIYNEANEINSTLNYFQLKLNEINQTLLIKNNLTNLIDSSQDVINNFSIINNLWKIGDYDSVNETIAQITRDEKILLDGFIYENKSIYSQIEKYNFLVEKIQEKYKEMSNLSNEKMNESDAQTLDLAVTEFNSNIVLFSKNPNIENKLKIAEAIFNITPPNTFISNGTYQVNKTLIFNLTQINLTISEESFVNFTLNNPLPECCVYNICKICGKVENAYPILFIHGHDFNKDISAEYSLNTFQDLQNRLDSDGFLNAGQLTIYDIDPKVSGLLGLSGVPITVKSTYYYDVLKESSSIYLPVQTKSESIDIYSIRLKTLVDKLKYRTGQPKVIIIAHSMGGLVARRYVQLFGNDSVEKLILIGTPNKGITGNTVSLCSLFGAKAECTDMTSGSLFLNKINYDPSPNVKTYNIIGTGCQMDNSLGDGIVLNENGILENSEQYYVNGTCLGINLLHIDILNTNKYPETYSIIKKILTGNED